jgi:hypothetical protein
LTKLAEFRELLSKRVQYFSLSKFTADFLVYAQANYRPGTVAPYRHTLKRFRHLTGDIGLTQIYSHLQPDQMHDAVNRLAVTLNEGGRRKTPKSTRRFSATALWQHLMQKGRGYPLGRSLFIPNERQKLSFGGLAPFSSIRLIHSKVLCSILYVSGEISGGNE